MECMERQGMAWNDREWRGMTGNAGAERIVKGKYEK